MILLARASGVRLARLEKATRQGSAPAEPRLKDAEIAGYTPNGDALMFATLSLPEPGCWTLSLSAGTSTLEYTLYAYPWNCRAAGDRSFGPPPGVTPGPCARP